MQDESTVPEVDIVPILDDPETSEDLEYWRPVQFRKVPLESLRKQIMALYEPPLKTASTERMMRRAFAVLAELGLQTSSDLDEQFIAKLVKSRPPSNSSATVIALLRCVRLIANYCVRRGYLRSSPFIFRPVGKWVRYVPTRKRRHHSRDEIRKVLDLERRDIDESTGWKQWKCRRLFAVTAAAAYGGFRASEVFHLHVEDIDFENELIDVRSRGDHFQTKTASAENFVAMPPALVPILRDWMSHRLDAPEGFLSPTTKDCPFVFPGVQRTNAWQGGPPGSKPLDRLKAVGRRAGVEGLTFLSLRHTWATLAEHLGIPPAVIKRILRHTTEATSEHWYRHREASYLREAVRDFDF